MKAHHHSLWLFLMLVTPLQATVYKWTDPEGHVQYSQTPPVDEDPTLVTLTPTANALTSTEAKQNVQRMEAEFAKNQEKAVAEKKQAQEQAKETAIKTHNCEQARSYLSNLNSRARIQIQQPDGQSHWLTPEELAAEKNKTQKMIEQFCEH